MAGGHRTAARAGAALVIAAAALPAAGLPGLPEAPTAWTMPHCWFGHANDLLGNGLDNVDDFRTAGFSAGWRAPSSPLVVAADYSILTNRGLRDPRPPGRIDELTATAGWTALERNDERRALRWRVVVGGGLRASGDLGGDEIQNAWHDVIDEPRVDLPYERNHRVDPLAFAQGSLLWSPGEAPNWPLFAFLANARWGLRLDAASLATAEGESQSLAGARLVLLGLEAQGWIGWQYRWNRGDHATTTAKVVAEREEAGWFTIGTDALAADGLSLFFDGGLAPARREASATVGALWELEPGRQRPGETNQVVEEFGVYAGLLFGVRARWQPEAWESQPRIGLATSLFFDYRFGTSDAVAWQDEELTVDQWSLGVELRRGIALGWLRLTPFVDAGLGLRREGIQIRGPSPRFPEEDATTGVAVGGVGLEIGRSRPPDRLSVSVVYDWWWPFTEAEARRGGDRATYLEQGDAPGARLVLYLRF